MSAATSEGRKTEQLKIYLAIAKKIPDSEPRHLCNMQRCRQSMF